ncbi:uncharacterized protein PHACADRAFT_256317 [Phanerochaete carnosa HHB-10118-sp]|uniref:RRM domain-containing protein n=1 Tax=Phanerochaete carnosa (strain HHB-10118-sp) TaxID=650164 RepID=K5W9D6_PHACS|nr:uncharacterized protein PHACADRAFT_256317 [Phanerochaete carnosa HHB-10118-sp]EKM55589.1 hypothetical protein PHACADRAFT_256317 [Phanerochaete carnosa HHB-10118-sp]
MEEGTKTKKTVFVGNLANEVDETALLETFATFGASMSGALRPAALTTWSGDVIEVQIPPATTDPNRQTGVSHGASLAHMTDRNAAEEKHKGYGFVTFASTADAQDAIDNMDLNELQGKVLRVNLARPSKMPVQGLGNKASMSFTSAGTRSCLTPSFLQFGNRRIGSNNMRSRWQRAVVGPMTSSQIRRS